MRVLHIAQTIAGGIASYLEEIASYQTRHFGRHGVRFLIPAESSYYLPAIPSEQITEFAPHDRSARGLLSLALAVHSEVRCFLPDIVHLHSTFAGAIARPLLWLLGPRELKVIYCPHGWSFGMEVPAWTRAAYVLVERCLAPLADSIVSISRAEYELASLNGLPQKKLAIIRNGIATKPPSIPPHSFGAGQNAIHLCFVGRHDRQKGLDLLLDAFCSADLSRVHLHVVGAPVSTGSSTGSPLGETPNVTFYGWQPRSVVSALISGADAVIMPSRWEGFGLVALEAMRLGKPVIASRRGALPEVVSHGRTGLLFDLDHSSQITAILQTLDKGKLARMGRAARSEFLREFTADRLNSQLIELYRTCCGRVQEQRSGIPKQGQSTLKRLAAVDGVSAEVTGPDRKRADEQT